MNISRVLNTILLFLSTILFIVSSGFAFWIYAHSNEQTLFPYYLTFAIMFLLISLYVAMGMTKIENKEILQIILSLSIVIMAIINLFVSLRGTFDVIFNPCIIIIYSINFTILLIRVSLNRVKQKVEFVPMRPIIKP